MLISFSRGVSKVRDRTTKPQINKYLDEKLHLRSKVICISARLLLKQQYQKM